MPSTEIYTLSLHDALPICIKGVTSNGIFSRSATVPTGLLLIISSLSFHGSILIRPPIGSAAIFCAFCLGSTEACARRFGIVGTDRKSTRLNSSHSSISYAVHRNLHSFPTRRSSDLHKGCDLKRHLFAFRDGADGLALDHFKLVVPRIHFDTSADRQRRDLLRVLLGIDGSLRQKVRNRRNRSEEHTSELQSQFHLVCRPPKSTLFPYTTLFRSA